MKTKRNTYTLYQSDRPNIFGGYNTFSSPVDAIKDCRRYAVAITFVRNENNLGIDTKGNLAKEIWKFTFYEKRF